MLQNALDHANAIRPFRVAIRRFMTDEAGMRNEKRAQGDLEEGDEGYSCIITGGMPPSMS